MSLFDRIGKLAAVSATLSEPEAPAVSGAQASSEPEAPSYLDRLEQSKNELLEEISGLFQELGRAYYELHADDPQPELEERLSAIRDACAEIDQYQQQADEIAARQRCQVCGAALAEGAVFCSICGTKLPEVAGGEAEQRFCPRCGTAIGPDDMFCIACGADLRNQ